MIKTPTIYIQTILITYICFRCFVTQICYFYLQYNIWYPSTLVWPSCKSSVRLWTYSFTIINTISLDTPLKKPLVFYIAQWVLKFPLMLSFVLNLQSKLLWPYLPHLQQLKALSLLFTFIAAFIFFQPPLEVCILLKLMYLFLKFQLQL